MKSTQILKFLLFSLLLASSSCKKNTNLWFQCDCTYGGVSEIGQPPEPVDISMVCCGNVICAKNATDAKNKCLSLWQNGVKYRNNPQDEDWGCVIELVGDGPSYYCIE
jgi:hypothetical protein